MLRLPGDVIILPEAKGRWVIANLFSRTYLGVETDALEPLRESERVTESELKKKYGGRTFAVWEITAVTNLDCSADDPTGYIRDVEEWPAVEELNIAALIERFEKRFLLIGDMEEYTARFAPKSAVVDHEHFGNLREQLVQEIVLKAKNPETWWEDQKFTPDMRGIKESLYKAIQEHFLKNYFKRNLTGGKIAVDLGCGPGYYANMMARSGATVLGVDPNTKYIEMAEKNAEKSASFKTAHVGTKGALDFIPSDYADYVFMSDCLLFYFVPDNQHPGEMDVLLSDIKRILKKDGLFISCEPHHVFTFVPRLGDADRPFTVIADYRDKKMNIAGTMSEHVQACAKNGFAVRWMEELLPDPAYSEIDPRGYHFTRQFPLWVFYEMSPL